MFTLFKTPSYNLTLISSLFADGIHNDASGSSYSSVDEDASAVAVVSELKEKTIYMKKGTPCINCNAKYGKQCQKEVIYNSKCLSSSVRTEV